MIRLNKFLSEAGIASRRKAEELIRQGRVSINGVAIEELSAILDPEKDIVTCDGEIVKRIHKVYYMLNKPKGYITTTSDDKGRPKVTDLLPKHSNLFPVGRLDYNTTGLLILTNDGDFANLIAHPKFKFEREYSVHLHKPLTEKDKTRLLKGIHLDNKRSRFIKIIFPVKTNFKKLTVVTEEGRNRFVKRMFAALGYRVKSLERRRFGPFELKNLPSGKFKSIKKAEVESIKRGDLT